jgi:hypothetical protein
MLPEYGRTPQQTVDNVPALAWLEGEESNASMYTMLAQ